MQVRAILVAAQSWNALTVGAYSATDDMSGAPDDFAGYVPIAPRGELSPVSRTSVLIDRQRWPFKARGRRRRRERRGAAQRHGSGHPRESRAAHAPRPPGEKPPTLDTETGWLCGSNQQQAPGSLHTDIWTGPAINLANKGAIAVYPVAGWWKTRRAYDQSDLGVDYSLVLSIEAPEIDVDLWTPVAQQITSIAVIEA